MSHQTPHGAINQDHLNRKVDYLYRISIKCLIRNENGGVLVVKEADRTWWDLPGGGMDHGEDVEAVIARELREEVGLKSDFTHSVIAVDDPYYIEHVNVWQVRIIFEVKPESYDFEIGEDTHEVAFVGLDELKASQHPVEQRVYEYAIKTGQ